MYFLFHFILELVTTTVYSSGSHGPPWRKIAAAMSTSNFQNQSSTTSRSSTKQRSNTVSSSSSTTMGSGSNLSQNSGTLTQSTSDLHRSTSTSSCGVKSSTINASNSPIVLQGSHKKFKTMKKKYFVLYRDDTKDGTFARLEYYDSEKKFKARAAQPKRKILLKSATITRRLDTKHKFVIAFQTKEEPFSIVLETESDLNEWLQACLAVQRGEQIVDPPKNLGKKYICITIHFYFKCSIRDSIL